MKQVDVMLEATGVPEVGAKAALLRGPRPASNWR